MKKTLSLLLSFIMLICSVTATGITAHAEGWVDYSQEIQFDTIYSECVSKSDPGDYGYDMGVEYDYRYDAFLFTVPVKGTVTMNIESKDSHYFDYHTDFYIYKSTDLENAIWASYDNNDDEGYSSAKGLYYGKYSAHLSPGNYYLLAEYAYMDYDEDYYDFSLTYKPNIAKPSSLKISSRGVYSLKLSWGKVGNVTGYQVQRKVGDKFKHIAYTSKNYYTVKDLAAATNYALRVRAYKTIDGKKYFSSYRYLTTPTKPSKVSIKTPTTNSKHQITVKWKAMARGSGYKVQFSRKKDFSTVIATRLVSGKTKTSYTGKNLTKGKKYYVRVRGYKTVDGKNYYGAWSDVKSIKCK